MSTARRTVVSRQAAVKNPSRSDANASGSILLDVHSATFAKSATRSRSGEAKVPYYVDTGRVVI